MTNGNPLLGALSLASSSISQAVSGAALSLPSAASSLASLPLSFLLVSSVLPIVKVLLIAGTGLVTAQPFFDVLHADARKSLSKLVFTIFLPAIIFVNLGEAISVDNLLRWWFIPVNVILASAFGCSLGMLVAWLTDCPPEYFRVVTVLTGIGNMGNMPLVLLSAVCSDSRNPFGGAHECNRLGTAYISLGMWTAAIVMWGAVYNYLAPPEEWLPGYHRPLDEEHVDQKFVDAPMVPYVEPPEGESDLDLAARAALVEDDGPFNEEEWSVRGNYMVNRKTGRARTLTKQLKRASVVVFVKAPNQFGEILKVLHIYDIFRPPVLAAFLAMLLGMISPLRYLFFDKDGALRFLTDALAVLGQAMIPCILLVLGANLVKGPGITGLPPRTTLALVTARLVVVPIMGIFIVLSADMLGLLPPHDKMFRFVLLIQHAMPSSIQIGTACSLRGFGEREVSAVLFFEHLSAVVSMACCLFVFFYILYG